MVEKLLLELKRFSGSNDRTNYFVFCILLKVIFSALDIRQSMFEDGWL